MKFIIGALLLCASLFSFASEGDTTVIRVHDAVDLTWFGNYDQMGFFPDGNTSYNKIILKYTMGCASSGCSDWDYTTQIQLLRPTGQLDSNIVGYDTVSTNPLVVDTMWNVFEVKEEMEMGRAITPYGTYMADGSNGFNNSWERVFYYDITDFTTLLKDSIVVRAHYSGWSSGFSATLDFLFIEGTPSRPVLDITNIYSGSWSYQNQTNFESTALPEKNVSLQAGNQYKLRVTPSGHGFDNNTGCAEFCERFYSIKLNGTTAFQQNMWRDDCGLNAVYPQGGTWVYNRANWCPGDYVWTFEHELTNYVSALPSVSIDMDIQPIVWSGNQAPSYIIDALLVEYGGFNYQNDLGLEQIMAPNNKYEYNRNNPICGNPIVKVKNYGELTVTQFDIEYWVEGGQKCWMQWTGSLASGESEIVELPAFDWSGFTEQKFYARVEWPNDVEDELSINDQMTTHFDIPERLDSIFVVRFWANNFPGENSYVIKNDQGVVVHTNSTFSANTLHWDTISLPDGCYYIEFRDFDQQLGGGDGLTWWANNDGSGSFQLRRLKNSTQNSSIIQTFNPDFGNNIFKAFTVGYTLGNGPAKQPCVEPDHTPTGIKDLEEGFNPIKVYPNPATDEIYVDWMLEEESEVSLWDLSGRKLQSEHVRGATTLKFQLHKYPQQVYIVKTTNGNKVFTQRFVLNR
ncbi:MAG: T9SS type A sorting domain-containing protein [Chitinophagales bacterium]|nr:T9SS type A sorting domain-containing protein [Chitinophagales bacterium]